jgi:hypothetical protein
MSQEDSMGSEVIIVPSAFLMVAYVFHVVASIFTRRQQIKSTTEFQAKLLDRMGTVHDLNEFLNTDGGQRFLSSVSTEPPGGSAHQRVLRAFQAGIVMVCLGLGIFFYVSDVDLPYGAYENVSFVGTVSFALGVGLLLSGWVSLRLSRKLGLINGKPEPVRADAVRSV